MPRIFAYHLINLPTVAMVGKDVVMVMVGALLMILVMVLVVVLVVTPVGLDMEIAVVVAAATHKQQVILMPRMSRMTRTISSTRSMR